ncbi:phage tail tape measure protein [Shewanella algae]|uniref:phage tail tape measure protein n=1 Tax=Shewanella algae TaxID=38313 RepID=UPI002554BE39|nr:phage tail tape measure protein [Shewanella algae]MDL2195544.1 phage tail tape measure protein [Shewanella algae]
MSLPQPLMFTVGLIDQITKPIAKISHAFNGLAADYQRGTMQMASGIGGIAASALGIHQALMPAIEMDRALGEVKSLGVRESALKSLAGTSYDFALQYGKSATDFVRSSYDIQSAIAGLNDADLSRFTLASNVLAVATKADAATITSYMGTMYGIFKNDALAMGQGNWVEQVTGMTATAVQAFKTTGAQMSAAFTGIGAEATSAGVAMNEQMAILGTLQATMGGSESGTKYKAFLAGVGKAQDALGLKFTDSNNRLLPMVDILNRIRGKYGDVLDVTESDALARAFGSQEAVATIKLLLADVNGLADSINMLGKVTGMEQAEQMAAAMTDQTERLTQSWYVVRAAFGSAILPTVNGFMGKIADLGKDVIWFTQMFPNLTKLLGYTALAVAGLVAAFGALTVVVGIFNILASPIVLVTAAVIGLVAAIGFGIAYADELRSMLSGTGWGDGLLAFIDDISVILGGLKDDWLGAVEPMMELLQNMSPVLQFVGGVLLKGIAINLTMMGRALAWIIGLFADAIGMALKFGSAVYSTVNDVIGWFKGDSESTSSAPAMPKVDAIAPTKANIPRGGLIQQMSNASSKTTTFGDVIIQNPDPNFDFVSYVEMRS